MILKEEGLVDVYCNIKYLHSGSFQNVFPRGVVTHVANHVNFRLLSLMPVFHTVTNELFYTFSETQNGHAGIQEGNNIDRIPHHPML